MSPEAQRIAIAEARGWTAISVYPDGAVMAFDPSKVLRAKLPDFPNDLNAIHEAGKTLTVDQGKQFIIHLWVKVAHYHIPEKFTLDAAFLLANATARQHAEAFLRTLGKWRDAG